MRTLPRTQACAKGIAMPNTGDPTGKRPHSVADHSFGEALDHVHDGDADHDHDYLDPDVPLEDNPLWHEDNVTLVSVGMDIGSSGTQSEEHTSELQSLRHLVCRLLL